MCNKNKMCQQLYTVSQKKLDPFYFSITLVQLQTEINCDQVYPKIYHHIPNLLVHYIMK